MRSKNNPRISICIPTFNRADLLDQTLQSVANQTIKPYEVIVTDNCSTDKTSKVGNYYRKKYGFTFVVNNKNLGMIGNWNKAISKAKGDYICLLHSDDLISPDWHETWLATLKKHKADFYTSAIAIINDENVPQFTAHIFKQDQYMKQPNTMNLFLQQLAPMIAPSGASIYHKKIFKKIGLYDPSYGTAADVPHFLSLASRFDVFYRDKIVFAWRSHDAQTFDKEKQNKSVEADLKRLENYFNIITTFYKENYKRNKKMRNFVLTHFFMALASTNLYIAKLQFNKVIGANKLAKKYFPSLYTKKEDWKLFLTLQASFIKRAFMLKRLSRSEKKELSWLKDIKQV